MTDLFYRDGSPVSPEQAAKAVMGKTGVSGTIAGRPYCSRCGGTGIFHWYSMGQRCGGTCFLCNGEPKPEQTRVFTAKRLAQLQKADAKRAAKREAAAAERQSQFESRVQQRRDAYLAFYAELIERAGEIEDNEIATRLLGSFEHYGSLTGNQTNLLARFVAEDEARRNRPNRYFGNVGQRLEISGHVERVITMYSQFGTRFLNVIRADSGESIKYFGNFVAEEGERVAGKATIKEHSDYNGECQTIISRPKWAA